MARGKRQGTIPGTAESRNPKVSEAAEMYEAARKRRQAAGREERPLKLKLIEAMKEAGMTQYRDPDAVPPFKVELTEGATKVKVIREGDDDASAEAAE